MNAAERRLITYTAAAHAVVHITELTYPALLTRIGDDFGVRAVILGTIASVFSWAFGSSAIPAGFLTDRLGSRRVLFYAFAGGDGVAGPRRPLAQRVGPGRHPGPAGVLHRPLPPGGPLPDGPGGAAARPGARVPRRLRQRRPGAGARPGRRPGDSRRLAAGVLRPRRRVRGHGRAALDNHAAAAGGGGGARLGQRDLGQARWRAGQPRRRSRGDGRIRDAPARGGAAKALAPLPPAAAAGVRRLRPQRRRLPRRDHLPPDAPGGLRG